MIRKLDLYRERAYLIAALSKLFPASLETDPDEPLWPVCIIHLPAGQASWHISPDDMDLFSHLRAYPGRIYDGHSTKQKYARLKALRSPERVK